MVFGFHTIYYSLIAVYMHFAGFGKILQKTCKPVHAVFLVCNFHFIEPFLKIPMDLQGERALVDQDI
jgi:hypothetical protein